MFLWEVQGCEQGSPSPPTAQGPVAGLDWQDPGALGWYHPPRLASGQRLGTEDSGSGARAPQPRGTPRPVLWQLCSAAGGSAELPPAAHLLGRHEMLCRRLLGS